MIIYSVTVSLAAELAEEWLLWMIERHIPDVMKTGLFLNHHIHRILLPEPEEGTVTFNIQYECQNMHHLKLYNDEYAVGLQAAHAERYAGKFVAFRTVLDRL